MNGPGAFPGREVERMKRTAVALMLASVAIAMPGTAESHCEIPCGIYDDMMRVYMLYEHMDTIEKSMNQIEKLSREGTPNWNQLVRWTMNKEKHADEIQHIVTQYFMTQRIKPANERYTDKLTILHGMLLSAMKAKQTVDTSHVELLRGQIGKFSEIYFSAEDMKHFKEHHPAK